LSGLLMAAAKPARVAMAAALLFLFTPRTFLVLEQGWTESYAVLAIALAVFVAIRIPRAIPVAVGLTLATKQYLVFVLPFALLFFADDWKSRTLLALRSIAIAAAVSLPLILWNVPDFMNSAVIMFLNLPFRPDSLSFPAWLGSSGEPGLPTWLGYALLVPAGLVAALRLPRTPAAFALAIAFAFFVFFAFNKQAFVNYYYFIIGALCCALAAMGPGQPPQENSVFDHAQSVPQTA